MAQSPRTPLTAPLTVEEIMQRPEAFVGGWPSGLAWTPAGDAVTFQWNPSGAADADSLFRAAVSARGAASAAVRLGARGEREAAPAFAGWHTPGADAARGRLVGERAGDLFLTEAGRTTRLTRTRDAETAPTFLADGRVAFVREAGGRPNGFALDVATGSFEQLTDIRPGRAPAPSTAPQDVYLREQQRRLFDVVRDRVRRDSLRAAAREAAGPRPVYTGDDAAEGLRIDPTGRFATFRLRPKDDPAPTRLASYVTDSGAAELVEARSKIGAAARPSAFTVLDLARDTSYAVRLRGLPGADEAPAYRVALDSAAVDSSRVLTAWGPVWSPDGRWAAVDVRSRDNKDRWIARLDPETGALTVLDRQHDDAWIGGPGIASGSFESPMGWTPDGRGGWRLWFHSERTGWSHLYSADPVTDRVEALTEGPFEVTDVQFTRDGRTVVFQSSEGDLAQRHVWRMPVGPPAAEAWSRRERLTTGTGRWDALLAPSDDRIAYLFSTANRPPDVFVGRVGSAPERLTESATAAWTARRAWLAPEIVQIPASDGALVPARIYRPESVGATPNGAAVVFVHGAGYLQNAHRWWSQYNREFLFHHLLAERGYVVLDPDFRASAGYGRDWRTAVYRHAGGRDLQDVVDASRYLGAEFGVEPERVAVYGGSYGGFIALMALFTEGEHFGGGAALRAVTDWAHYNDGYTRNLLNAPSDDSLAYARSSPIEFAAGLADPLLMAHGLVDDNVQVQDIFRLSQRLIELGKTDWDLAVYPVEPHAFREPSSWADEYRRVLSLIERSVGPARPAPTGDGGADCPRP